MKPTTSSVYVDQLLTSMALIYMQNASNFVAKSVFPVVPVDQQTGLFNTYPRGYFFRTEMKPRPLGRKPEEAGYEVSSDTYITEEYALEKPVDDRTRVNQRDPLGPDRGATTFLAQNAIIHFEKNWADTYFKTGVWTTEYTGVAANPNAAQFLQFDQAGSDPVKLVRRIKTAMLLATGFEPNKIVLGRAVYDALAEHASILDKIKYTQTGIVTRALLAALFEVDEVLVAGGVENTAAEGQADSNAFIVDSKAMLAVYAAPAPSIEVPSAGYTFAWTALVPELTNEYGGVIERFRDDRARSDIFSIRNAWGMKKVAADLGVYCGSCLP
jgi:hypothetical protein